MSARADELARLHTDLAIRTAVEIMTGEHAEDRDRLRAAELVLDRGHGKPIAAVIQLPAPRRAAEALAAMDDDALLAVLQRQQLPRLAQDAEIIEVSVDRDPLLE